MKLRLFVLMFILFLASCSDDVAQEVIAPWIKQGFIIGKITGTSANETYTFNDSFNLNYHTHYLGSVSAFDENDGIYTITFGRMDVRTGSFATLIFNNLENLQDPTPTDFTIDVWYLKSLNNNTVANFGMSSGGLNSSSITDFSFNPETGVLKGKFSLSGPDNSTGKNATVTGEFNGKVARYFY